KARAAAPDNDESCESSEQEARVRCDIAKIGDSEGAALIGERVVAERLRDRRDEERRGDAKRRQCKQPPATGCHRANLFLGTVSRGSNTASTSRLGGPSGGPASRAIARRWSRSRRPRIPASEHGS